MEKFFIRNSGWPTGIKSAAQQLLSGHHRHDVLEKAIRAVECDETINSVGYGGFPNIDGEMELDAAFMDGNTRLLGAVAGMKHYLPVRVARRLMETRLHTFLEGEGAEGFARDMGFEREEVLSPAQKGMWEQHIKPLLDKLGNRPLIELVREVTGTQAVKMEYDTVVMAMSDGNGISTATSTSGWFYKHPGRLGDASISGAGYYVDSRFGACLCTYTGEMAMRAGTARYVVAKLEDGKSLNDAMKFAVDDVAALRDGFLATLTIHAVNADGEAHVVTINPEEPEVKYWYWLEGMPRPECRRAEIVKLNFPRP